jgi:hypothetical protein
MTSGYNMLTGIESLRAGLRGEASTRNQAVNQMASDFYTKYGTELLNQDVNTASQLGQNYLTYATGLSSTPQLVNTDTGLNLGLSYDTAKAGLTSSLAASSAATTSGLYQGLGSLASGYLSSTK